MDENKLLEGIMIDVSNEFNDISKTKVKSREIQLCHYTSIKNSLNIINTNEYWLHPYDRMNDPEEIKYGIKIFSEVIECHQFKSDPTKYTFLNNCLECIRKSFASKELSQAFNCFIGSFMGIKNKDTLYPWIAYGDDGKGVCLEFTIPTPLNLSDNYIIPLFKVIYNEKKIKLELIKLITLFFKKCNYLKQSETHRAFMGLLLNKLPSYKHKAYALENEYRLIVAATGNMVKNHSFFKINEHGNKFCAIENFTNDKLKSITLGPQTYANKVDKQVFEIILQNKNYSKITHNDIFQSTIPFRKHY